MTVINRRSARTGYSMLKIGTSVSALSVALLLATAAQAQDTQAGSKVPDPAGSSATAANPNEAGSAQERRDDNAAVTGTLSQAQTETAAQTAGDVTAAATGDPVDGDIVVTGFRRSLENAVAEKKNRDQIVESVSAEDIGKLPDASIAESIARLRA